MPVTWFYGRGSDITGPVSGPELTDLVANGGVLSTDMLWQDDAEDGVLASQVDGLFPTAATEVVEALPATIAGEWKGEMAGTREVKKGRAVAGKGALLVGQDGKTVKFRMKCTVCGHEDSSWKTIPIPHGTARAGFFCRKCRKRRDAEVHGYH